MAYRADLVEQHADMTKTKIKAGALCRAMCNAITSVPDAEGTGGRLREGDWTWVVVVCSKGLTSVCKHNIEAV